MLSEKKKTYSTGIRPTGFAAGEQPGQFRPEPGSRKGGSGFNLGGTGGPDSCPVAPQGFRVEKGLHGDRASRGPNGRRRGAPATQPGFLWAHRRYNPRAAVCHRREPGPEYVEAHYREKGGEIRGPPGSFEQAEGRLLRGFGASFFPRIGVSSGGSGPEKAGKTRHKVCPRAGGARPTQGRRAGEPGKFFGRPTGPARRDPPIRSAGRSAVAAGGTGAVPPLRKKGARPAGGTFPGCFPVCAVNDLYFGHRVLIL